MYIYILFVCVETLFTLFCTFFGGVPLYAVCVYANTYLCVYILSMESMTYGF